MKQTEKSLGLPNVKKLFYKTTRKIRIPILLEEKIPLPLIIHESSTTWKQNWFVKNIIMEFPIIGDLFMTMSVF